MAGANGLNGGAVRGGRGDEIVKLKVMLPPEPNAEFEAFLLSLGTTELRSAPGYAAMIISKQDFLHRAQVNRETLEGVILSLLDQLHGLRKALADLLQSARQQGASPTAGSSIRHDQDRE